MDQKTQNALQVLRNVCRQYKGNADEHELLAQSFQTIVSALAPKTGVGTDKPKEAPVKLKAVKANGAAKTKPADARAQSN